MALHDPPRLRFALCAGALLLGACGSDGPPPTSPDEPAPVVIPARGTAASFDVATWNLEWFGDPGNGPADEALQLQRVREVIAGSDLDLWGLQEVVSRTAFETLLAGLPGYAGLLANAPSVQGGAASYSDFGDLEQKVALLYRTSVVEVVGAKIILATHDHDFAGRPPLEVQIRIRLGGATVDAVVVVLHAKAGTDEASWDRRSRAATALRDYLNQAWPTHPVWVVGDFNDDVDTSISPGRPSPYATFVAASPAWWFATAALSQAGASSTVGFPDVIDHQLVSDEAGAWYQSGSAEAYRLDTLIPQYATTTSDHFPVLARYGVR